MEMSQVNKPANNVQTMQYVKINIQTPVGRETPTHTPRCTNMLVNSKFKSIHLVGLSTPWEDIVSILHSTTCFTGRCHFLDDINIALTG